MTITEHEPNIVEWSAASVALQGQPVSGDLPVVAHFPSGVLLALVDGLGHGAEARTAAQAVGEVLTEQASESPPVLMQRCHERARRTRGAAMSVASLNGSTSTLTWLGVGNVDGLLWRANGEKRALGARGGVVGYQLPPLRPETLPLRHGDLLIFTSDGIRSDMAERIQLGRWLDETPQAILDAIMHSCAKGSDDASVLVARYLGLQHIVMAVRADSDIATAHRHVRRLAREAGLSDLRGESLVTATSELARNILVHAGDGLLEASLIKQGKRFGVRVVASDHGPGIHDVERALVDGYSSGGGLGLGLSSARRLVDEFEIESTPGQGTTMTLKSWAHD
jgi:anti-sigma regulatory factor (Ser/Thr protein kinase)